MTDTRRSDASAPWITAAVLAAIAIALVAVLIFVIRPAHNRHVKAADAVGLTKTQQSAVTAGATQILNTLTYARKTFDADYARTLAGATGALKSDLQKQKATILAQMNANKFDLQGAVTDSAFEETSGTKALILVSAEGYVIPDGGKRTLKTRARFEVTMTKVGTKWLASDLQSVGLI